MKEWSNVISFQGNVPRYDMDRKETTIFKKTGAIKLRIIVNDVTVLGGCKSFGEGLQTGLLLAGLGFCAEAILNVGKHSCAHGLYSDRSLLFNMG
jgi:hypothetical protein